MFLIFDDKYDRIKIELNNVKYWKNSIIPSIKLIAFTRLKICHIKNEK